LEDIDKYILIRDAGLDASGKLDKITINLTVNLKNTAPSRGRR
jgi:hypothetical protein